MNEHFGVTNNIVVIDDYGFHRMDYEKLIAPVVRAVQELDAAVREREMVIAAQQAHLNAVLARLTALEQHRDAGP